MVYTLCLIHQLYFHQVGVLRVAFRQRARALGGQYIDTAAVVYFLAIWGIPSSFTKGNDTRHHTWGDFGTDVYFTAIVEDTDKVAIFDAALFGINRFIHISCGAASLIMSTLP